ncbi:MULTISPECIES: ABC transporter permease [unclassified Undibacterium]|uniref:ABC transporter permease n=1 Tax=unclassified Undibacterium TaxID=2630295 RepID=UPI002AC8D8A8|nr:MULTISPECIES: ABC transporter permease [unclassified Undibacterium]MEB0139926.1 ABC transporter permease [Undibacterium sp. CCC2.1]MEB0172899.1 ABC transporter permease [Undibacterium sp. CCC1.1]MEB0176726.1 ABC transporter permease [Undibacterium sp. CCC3.4]MEB0216653.1 ABC transporter permease [Undibacterium sp. 5I2]WPX44965.1 ABC transporter permease [Undibacterium sp. CCC3.4]
MTKYSTSPLQLARTLFKHRELIIELAKRDAVGKYKGSKLGVLWSLLTPILMLVIYTFVFGEIFQARWSAGNSSRSEFAIVLFTGLIIFNLFAENITRAPGLILLNESYVKKIIFPLEILPCVNLLSSMFHMLVSASVLLIFQLILIGHIPLTVFFLPFIVLPFFLFCLGFSWLLSALGVFLRDIGQTIGIFVTGLMFLSPVFFPLSSVPVRWQKIAQFNPLVYPIEQARNVQIWGLVPDLSHWLIYAAMSCLAAWLGFVCFQKTRSGFADVL